MVLVPNSLSLPSTRPTLSPTLRFSSPPPKLSFFQNFERFLHVLDFEDSCFGGTGVEYFAEHFYDFRAVRQSFELGKVRRLIGRSLCTSLISAMVFARGSSLLVSSVAFWEMAVSQVRVRGGHRVRRNGRLAETNCSAAFYQNQNRSEYSSGTR